MLPSQFDYWDGINHHVDDGFADAAVELARDTPPGAPVVYLGEDWNPTTEYYANRPGMMLPTALLVPKIIDGLPHQGYRYVFSLAPEVDPIHILSKWPWVGIVGPRTYEVGQHRSDVSNAPVYASTARGAADPGATTLTCGDARLPVPLQGSLTTLRISSKGTDALRIWARDDLAPLPAVGTIYLGSAGDLRCTGEPSIGVTTSAP
jgi:hypothetical protein